MRWKAGVGGRDWTVVCGCGAPLCLPRRKGLRTRWGRLWPGVAGYKQKRDIPGTDGPHSKPV